TLTPAIMHGAAPGDPMWFVQSSFYGGSDVYPMRMTNVLSATPTLTQFTVPVPAFTFPPVATQPGTGGIQTNSARILSAAWRGGRLVAAQAVGVSGSTTAHARWYEFSTAGAAPTLTQTGTLDPGPTANTYYPS